MFAILPEGPAGALRWGKDINNRKERCIDMSEKKFGIVVIGYGGMGSRHCMLLSQTECVEVKGVYDILEEKNEAARQKGFFAYGSYEAVLADPAVDIVLVAIPNHLHKGVVFQALEAGKT